MPHSLEGMQIWDLAMSLRNQIRIAPSGHIVGLDFSAAVMMGKALGIAKTALAILFPSV